MLDPAFDWAKFKKLANDIQRIPSTVEDLKKSELEGLLYYVAQHRREHIVKANDLAIANNWSLDSFLFDPILEALELTVKTELARRDTPAIQKRGRKKGEVRQLKGYFKDAESFDLWLQACFNAGGICKDGQSYKGITEGGKLGKVVAMWEAAKDQGLLKTKIGDLEKVAQAIKDYFSFESLSKDVLTNAPNSALKKKTIEKIKVLKP
jgi:hypothetical protein